jgi:hypothetical protein
MPNPDNIKGKEFKPGQSGNPAGRPPGIPNAKTRYRRLLELTTKATNPITKEQEDFTQLELMDMAIFNKALKGDLAAYKEIMDRTEGRATQPVNVDGDVNIAITAPILGGISVQSNNGDTEDSQPNQED